MFAMQTKHSLANHLRRKMRLQQSTNHGGILHRRLGHAMNEPTKTLAHGLGGLAGFANGDFELGELHLGESEQNMFLAREVVKESALSEVRRLGDVFDGRFGVTFFGEEGQSGAEETIAKFSAAAGTGGNRGGGGRGGGRGRG